MASIFANAFRTQARVALVASRTRISPSTTNFFGLLTPHSVSSFSARPLSTSQVIRFEYRESRISEPNNTLYLGNLPYSVGEQELEDLLSSHGAIKGIRLGTHADGQSKGFAHVEFVDKVSAVRAYEAHAEQPLYMVGRGIRLDYAPPITRSALEPYHKLYVSSFSEDEEKLREHFSEFDANIIDVFLMRPMADGKRAGFIEFHTVDQATDAMNELNGRTLESGETLNVTYARPPRKSMGSRSHGSDWQGSDSGGRRGGGGYGRGGGGRGGGGSGGYGNDRGGGGRGGYNWDGGQGGY